jgi:hypothetical protein
MSRTRLWGLSRHSLQRPSSAVACCGGWKGGWLAGGLLAYGERVNEGRGSSKLPFARLAFWSLKPLRVDIQFLAECGGTHAAFGVLFNERMPVGVSIFSAYDVTSCILQEGRCSMPLSPEKTGCSDAYRPIFGVKIPLR